MTKQANRPEEVGSGRPQKTRRKQNGSGCHRAFNEAGALILLGWGLGGVARTGLRDGMVGEARPRQMGTEGCDCSESEKRTVEQDPFTTSKGWQLAPGVGRGIWHLKILGHNEGL